MDQQTPPETNTSTSPPGEKPLKGLWNLMEKSASAEEAATESAKEPAVQEHPTSTKMKSLWGVMQGSSTETPSLASRQKGASSPTVERTPLADQPLTAEPGHDPHASIEHSELSKRSETVEQHTDDFDDDIMPPEVLAPEVLAPEVLAPEILAPEILANEVLANEQDEADPEEIVQPVSKPEPEITRRTQVATSACWSAGLGLFAFAAAGLAYRPEFWSKIPGPASGFVGLMLGLIALGDIKRSRGRLTGQTPAYMGIAFGIVAMIAGPTLFAPWGASLRQYAGREKTHHNLTQIGAAMMTHLKQVRRFPEQGTFDTGKVNSGHSWMTRLLPYLDHENLYNQIDFTKPYDDNANMIEMQQQIPQFLAADQDRLFTTNGLAVSHFSGLAGELMSEDVGMVRIGVLDADNPIRQVDLLDGASQTMVAGEINFGFPAWGEPENVRQIGQGLNKAMDGFGNASGTGAMFLFADGSVRFFSNRTSPEVLQSLSTRNGQEVIPQQYR